MARSRGRSTFVRGPRRATDWSASIPQAIALSVPANSAVLDESFTPIVGGETLIRTRGLISFSSDQTGATELQLGAYGICVVTQQALSVGITAIPHPATDAAWGGWVVHQYLFAQLAVLSAAGIEPQFNTSFVIDSKGMRKVDEDERLVSVWENSHATHGFSAFAALRILSKVH